MDNNIQNQENPPSSQNEKLEENNQNILQENDNKEQVKEKKKVSVKAKKPFKYSWPIKVGILTLALALMFSIFSELMLSDAGIVVSLVVIVVLLAVSILFDMIGVAFAACPIEPLISMSSKKVKGSKKALNMVKNADKVSSFCSDVIGDICGILSGAAGAAITVKLIGDAVGSKALIIASVVSAVIAAITVFGKAMFKKVAIDKSVSIVSVVGKCLSIFSRKK